MELAVIDSWIDKVISGASSVGAVRTLTQEVEEGPQLVQRILEGRARDEQAVLGVDFAHELGQLAVLVFDAVCFVDHCMSYSQATDSRCQ